MTPTPGEIDFAGDCLLRALLMQTNLVMLRRTSAELEVQVGDLVIETSSRRPDWERLGYLVQIEEGDDPVYHIYSVARRVTQWRNASIARVGPPQSRLPGLEYPA